MDIAKFAKALMAVGLGASLILLAVPTPPAPIVEKHASKPEAKAQPAKPAKKTKSTNRSAEEQDAGGR